MWESEFLIFLCITGEETKPKEEEWCWTNLKVAVVAGVTAVAAVPHIKQAFLSFSYDFMFDRIMCVLVRIKVRRHLVISIIQFMNLISVHFWTYLFTEE